MGHVIAAAATMLFVAFNFWLWSLGQGPTALFWQSMGIACVVFPTLFLYVKRSAK